MRKKPGKNFAKLGIIFTFILLTLTSLSMSYAHWTDTINIQCTVTTGTWSTEETTWSRINDDPDDFTHEFPGNNWATYIKCTPEQNIQTFYLYAGQHHRVGTLNVSKDNNYLYIEYDLDPGYTMSESQVHVATTLQGIPQNNGNPPPGQFDYKEDYDPQVPDDTYDIDWNTDWDNQELCIATHAVVWGVF